MTHSSDSFEPTPATHLSPPGDSFEPTWRLIRAHFGDSFESAGDSFGAPGLGELLALSLHGAGGDHRSPVPTLAPRLCASEIFLGASSGFTPELSLHSDEYLRELSMSLGTSPGAGGFVSVPHVLVLGLGSSVMVLGIII